MKVGTLTFPGSPSHGASLQMYALQAALKAMGVDVEVINYVSPNVIHKKNKDASITSRLKNAVVNLILKDSCKAFAKFEKQMVLYPPKPVQSTEEMQRLSQRYDRIVVGSDQVWNPVVTGNDMNFYLAFCEDDRKKASYAPSFGADDVLPEDREQIAALLNRIPYLCTREERGREIIQELTGRDVPVVVDPTLLLSAEQWRTVKRPSGAKGKYVFVYTIKPSFSLWKKAIGFAKKNGYHFVYISGGLRGIRDKLDPNNHAVFGVGPGEFLDLIDNAQCVFTNSFHGTAMSIILNTKFFVEYSSDTNSRLTNIIKTFGLEACVVPTDGVVEELPEINYGKVNARIAEKKAEALLYLKEVIS